jgi:hypothetical protein
VPLDRGALADQGWTTTTLLDHTEIDRLRDLWATLAVPDDEPYFTTNIHTDRRTARAIDQELKAVLRPALERDTPDLEPFLAAFIFKGAHGGSVSLHPDWTYTDERVHRTTLFWCPLVDTDEENGTLHVIPGSHRWVSGLRGSGAFPDVADDVADLLAEQRVVVPLRAGEAIVYDAAVLHGSTPNTSDRPRPVAAVALAPRGAPLVHFHRAADGPTQGWAIDEAWYTVQPFGEPPSGYPEVEPWTDPVAPLRREQVLAAR